MFGRWSACETVSRAEQAHRWPESWVCRCLVTAADALRLQPAPSATVTLHQECPREFHWATVPVEVEQSPEGMLRQRLGEATGDRYDYIYFEGTSGSLSRQVRNTLAKLHVFVGSRFSRKAEADAALEWS